MMQKKIKIIGKKIVLIENNQITVLCDYKNKSGTHWQNIVMMGWDNDECFPFAVPFFKDINGLKHTITPKELENAGYSSMKEYNEVMQDMQDIAKSLLERKENITLSREDFEAENIKLTKYKVKHE